MHQNDLLSQHHYKVLQEARALKVVGMEGTDCGGISGWAAMGGEEIWEQGHALL